MVIIIMNIHHLRYFEAAVSSNALLRILMSQKLYEI